MMHPKTGVDLICFRLAGEEGMALDPSGAGPFVTKCSVPELWLPPVVLYVALGEATLAVRTEAHRIIHRANGLPIGRPQKLPRMNEPETPVPSGDFQRGAEAMRQAIMSAKFDALSAGELDLSRFEIRNVKAGPQ